MLDESTQKTFEENRTHLLSVAYRLTGSIADAEDAVQDAWLRLAGADVSEVRDLRAWLTTVVGRLCLDRLRSAAVRRETYVGQWLPEPIVAPLGSPAPPDPLDEIVRDEDNRLAALVVLDSLTPAQRVAFVLHDAFDIPFDDIARMIGDAGGTTRTALNVVVGAEKGGAFHPRTAAALRHRGVDGVRTGPRERRVGSVEPRSPGRGRSAGLSHA